ncbi:MAG: hypothetical protein U0R44_06035 [Candidatus Micrarchaeia archaeon]
MSRRDLNRNLASEKVAIIFYKVIEKGDARMLKPLSMDTSISLKMVRAILDNTIIPAFYSTLSKNLVERGVAPGTRVQLRARFSPEHSMLDPQLVGTKVLCEVTI